MSVQYQAVGWNRQKKVYDSLLVSGVLLYLAAFSIGHFFFQPEVTLETLLIRGFGSAALILLHIILSIGPLCRLNNRYFPLLYNRRHMGVTMFVLALAHGGLAMLQYHFFSDMHPLVSVFVSNGRYDSFAFFPFQPLGFIALMVLFLMAATSHDFWLTNLTAPVWKALHMGVYVAYGLVVAHVALGYLQTETHPLPGVVMALGFVWVMGIHLLAAAKNGVPVPEVGVDGWVAVGPATSIPEQRAQIIHAAGERIAVFRYDGQVSALSNVCQHQNGPLGEGRIIDGCVTCPWHGYQYKPHDGRSPAPFTEKVPTFRVKVVDGVVYVDPTPLPAGTAVPAAQLDETES